MTKNAEAYPLARKTRQRNNNKRGGNHDVLGITLIVISAFFLLCIVIPPILGVVSQVIFGVLLGTFGIMIYPIFVAMLFGGILLFNRRTPYVSVKTGVCVGLLIFFGLIILQLATTHKFLTLPYGEYISAVYAAKYSAGGVIFARSRSGSLRRDVRPKRPRPSRKSPSATSRRAPSRAR